MTSYAFVGDTTTTTALAVAATWPADPAPIIVEADPSGGSLAGWLGLSLTPSISTLVTTVSQRATTAPAESIARTVQRSRAGVDVVVAPFRSIEATQAVAEAEPTLIAASTPHSRPMLLDHGRIDARSPIPTAAKAADVVVVVHRQAIGSSAASAVRVERTSELLERLDATVDSGVDRGVEGSIDGAIAVVVIGDQPFDAADLVSFWERTIGRDLIAHGLPEDALAAATLSGRVGVSQRRLSRLPLMRAGRDVAAMLASHARRGGEQQPLDPHPHRSSEVS